MTRIFDAQSAQFTSHGTGNHKSASTWRIPAYSSTAWLKALFPYTGPPDEFAHRLQRVELALLDVNGQQGGQVICQFIYPEVDDSVQTGSVKFFLPPALKKQPNRRVPLLHMAGYEVDESVAMDYLKEGIAVSTVHAHPLNPMSRGPKLEWALMHAMRRLSFVDDTQVFVKGSSAGGYMALLLATETFPMACAMPMVPHVNWAYIFSYFSKSKAMASSSRTGSRKGWLPILARMAPVLEQAADRFGVNLEAPAYFELSPVRLVKNITTPILAVFSTGDMLMPIDQVGLELSRPFDAAKFPDGFTREMSAILMRPEQRVRLLDVIPSDRREVFTLTVPKMYKKKRRGGRDNIGEPLAMPFSRSSQWSIIVIDDGAPEPPYGHFKYYIAPDHTAFWRWALEQGIQEEQLTLCKLTWLMKRYLALQPLDFMVNPSQGPAHKCQLLDFPRAERDDVLRGLITFARSDAAACHLAKLYAALPANLKALGETLGTGSGESVRQALGQASIDIDGCYALGLTNRFRCVCSRWAGIVAGIFSRT